MDKARFHDEIKKLAAEYELTRNPYVKLVNEGKATREQLKGYPIQHYEMTVRDSAPISGAVYFKMLDLSQKASERAAGSFAEEALGIYSHSAGHVELLYELWERGLGLPREQLAHSVPSDEARYMNACLWRIINVKPRFVGIFGMLEEAEVWAYKALAEGMQRHYGIKQDDLRFLWVHHEADKEHGETGHWLIDELVTRTGREEEFLSEARSMLSLWWRGFESMAWV